MLLWNTWKKSFYAWESATARYSEQVLKNPLVLGPSGRMLNAAMRLKAANDRAMASWWGMLGLPTKRDQERAMHALNQLNSRLHDLEEQMYEIKDTGNS